MQIRIISLASFNSVFRELLFARCVQYGASQIAILPASMKLHSL
jgi:hypothetical protein